MKAQSSVHRAVDGSPDGRGRQAGSSVKEVVTNCLKTSLLQEE